MHLHVAGYTVKTCDAVTGEERKKTSIAQQMALAWVVRARALVRMAGPMMKDRRSGKKMAFDCCEFRAYL